MFIAGRRMVPIVGTILFGAIWLLALVTAGAVGLEILLRIQVRQSLRAQAASSPRFVELERAYEPFAVQHLHPQYLFFFPLDPRERTAISNEQCHLDADGFRGPGPANAGNRQLAFLLGGSAAFGYYASSDETTITGYLNRMQDRYFFVNAGVPSWNSTQEMYRLAFQILDYHPALVVTYDGSNDRAILEDYHDEGVTYPAGTPEHFDVLSSFVGRTDLGSLEGGDHAGSRWSADELLTYLFPQLSARIKDSRFGGTGRLESAAKNRAPLSESALQAASVRYLANLARMHDLTTAGGARFIAVFQPHAQLHRHFRSKLPFGHSEVVDRFRQAVLATYSHNFEFHDLSSVFDQYYADIPVMDRDIADDTVFIDEVHLYDSGNEIVARHLSKLLQ